MEASQWTSFAQTAIAIVGTLVAVSSFWLSYRKNVRSDLESDYNRRTADWQKCLADLEELRKDNQAKETRITVLEGQLEAQRIEMVFNARTIRELTQHIRKLKRGL